MVHDCRGRDICGSLIKSYNISEDTIDFLDKNGNILTSIPKIQSNFDVKSYDNGLYMEAKSQKSNTSDSTIEEILENSFRFDYRLDYNNLNFIIHYDDFTEREKEQIKNDIKSSYEKFKGKFCIIFPNYIDNNIDIYIFNNRNDYKNYGDLALPTSKVMLDSTEGITDGRKILCYKDDNMDMILAHELGHMFQKRTMTLAVKRLEYDSDVKSLNHNNVDFTASEFIANVIGQEISQKNYNLRINPNENYDLINESYDPIIEQSFEVEDHWSFEDNPFTGIICCLIGLITIVLFLWNRNEDYSFNLTNNYSDLASTFDNPDNDFIFDAASINDIKIG